MLGKPCAYKQTMWYKHNNMTANTKDVLFIENHPGHKFVSLVKRKNYVIPQICSTSNSLCNMRELQRGIYTVTDETKNLW